MPTKEGQLQRQLAALDGDYTIADEAAASAAVVVAGNATDAADARELLGALGLSDAVADGLTLVRGRGGGPDGADAV